MSEHI